MAGQGTIMIRSVTSVGRDQFEKERAVRTARLYPKEDRVGFHIGSL